MRKPTRKIEWPRIRNLPKDEQDQFRAWLGGQTVPVLDGVKPTEQDGYYMQDYLQWKRMLSVKPVLVS